MYLSLLFYYVGSNRCTPFFERNEELLFSGNMWLNKDLSVYMVTDARISVKTRKSNLVEKYNSRARKLSRATFSVKLVLTWA